MDDIFAYWVFVLLFLTVFVGSFILTVLAVYSVNIESGCKPLKAFLIGLFLPLTIVFTGGVVLLDFSCMMPNPMYPGCL